MSVYFTQSDLDIFKIPGFKERMSAIREKIRPKLEQFGEEVAPALMTQFKAEFFPHTAKHMRRKVNPPDETWVAKVTYISALIDELNSCTPSKSRGR